VSQGYGAQVPYIPWVATKKWQLRGDGGRLNGLRRPNVGVAEQRYRAASWSKSFRRRDEGEQCVDFHGVYNAHYVKRYHKEERGQGIYIVSVSSRAGRGGWLGCGSRAPESMGGCRSKVWELLSSGCRCSSSSGRRAAGWNLQIVDRNVVEQHLRLFSG
jgi:hypothetical protein